MKIGDIAPDFTLPDQDGEQVSFFSLLASNPVVLFFYPRAFTPGCTAESCAFRDAGEDLEALGAIRLGISSDSIERQEKFSSKYSLGYKLLSDANKEVAKLYGVKRPGPLFSKRTTFVISKDKKVEAIIHSEFDINKLGF